MFHAHSHMKYLERSALFLTFHDFYFSMGPLSTVTFTEVLRMS